MTGRNRRRWVCAIAALVCASASAATPFHEFWQRPGVMSGAFSPDETMIAAGGRSGGGTNPLLLLNAEDGSMIHSFSFDNLWTGDVQFSPDGRWVAASSGSRQVRVYDVEKRVELFSLNTVSQGAAIAFSPDSSVLAVGDGTKIFLYDSQTGQALRSFGGLAAADSLASINTIAFLPDGKSLASGSGARGVNVALILWDVETGHQRWVRQTAHTYGVGSISVSPDGKLLSTASEYLHFAGPVQFWESQTGALRHTLKSSAYSVAFSPQAPAFLTLSTNLELWALPPNPLLGESHPGTVRKQVRFNYSGTRFLTAGNALQVFETPLVITSVRRENAQLMLQWVAPASDVRLQSSNWGSPWKTHSSAQFTSALDLEGSVKFFRLAR